ncbi:MAG: universal stress protein [Rhodospirillaceae bacterium]|nr:universal stress protein [Rhodospirillaceae bacterium]
MRYRTILVAMSGGAASGGALELACMLAKHFQAHLEGFHVKLDSTQILVAAASDISMAMDQRMLDQFDAEAAATAKKAQAAFSAAASRHAVSLASVPATASASASAAWREETGKPPSLVSRRARFFDLVVLGASERIVDRIHSDTDEQTLFSCGRPVLLAPAKPPTAIGETIAIAWNGSSASVRSVVGALPLLAKARKICVITVGDRHEVSGTSLLEYLAWHGHTATHRHVESAMGVGPGEQILSAARDEGADLLVMGGYGHMPWREFLFGGATRQVLRSSLLPVLLAH